MSVVECLAASLSLAVHADNHVTARAAWGMVAHEATTAYRTLTFETGQSRWDHPLDPHFRRLYLHERFGDEHEQTTEIGDGTPTTIGTAKSLRFSHGIAGPSTAGAGGNCHRAGGNSATTGPGRQLPTTLPPRRARPNVVDFSSDKALESLRTRRLQHRHETSAATGSLAEEAMRIWRANEGSGAHHDARSSSWTNGQETWAENRNTGKSSSQSRRRRPASASALRESLEDRATEDARAGPRRGSESTAMLGTTTTHTSKEQAWCVDATRYHPAPAVRSRRPRSAKAALQRSPTHNRQQQLADGGGREILKERDYGRRYDDRRLSSRDDMATARRHMTQLDGHFDTSARLVPQTIEPGAEMDRATAVDVVDDEFALHHRPVMQLGGFSNDYSRGRAEGVIRDQELESGSGDADIVGISPPDVEERAWLLNRRVSLTGTG